MTHPVGSTEVAHSQLREKLRVEVKDVPELYPIIDWLIGWDVENINELLMRHKGNRATIDMLESALRQLTDAERMLLPKLGYYHTQVLRNIP